MHLALSLSLPSLDFKLHRLCRKNFKPIYSLEVSTPRFSPVFQFRWLLTQQVCVNPFFRNLFLLHRDRRPDRYCTDAGFTVHTSSGWNEFSQTHMLSIALSSCPFKNCSIPKTYLFSPSLRVSGLSCVYFFILFIHSICGNHWFLFFDLRP